MYYNPIRVFAAMTAHPVNPLNVGRSTAQPGIDQATAAAMCRKMPTLAFMAAMYKWAGDDTNKSFLKYRLRIAAVDLATSEGWKIIKGREYTALMAELVLNEVSDPKIWANDIDKAEFLGMHRSEFSRTWKKRYEMVYRVFDHMAQIGYRHIQTHNADDDFANHNK